MNPDQTIEECLATIATRDVQNRFVYPKEDVEARLKKELGQKTDCKPSVLEPFTPKLQELQPRIFLSADPDKFVAETLQAIYAVAKRLTEVGAKQFDVRFANSDVTGSAWGDLIQFRV